WSGNDGRQWVFQLLREELTCLDRTWAPRFAPKRNRCAADIPLDFAAKASIAVGVDGLLGRRLAWPERRACDGASITTGAVRSWRTRPWLPGKAANKQSARQKQRSTAAPQMSRALPASGNPNLAIRGYGRPLPLGPIEWD